MDEAVFNWSVWSMRYPKLVAGGVTEPLATLLFVEAQLFLNNGPCSIVTDIPTRTLLLYMIVAHLAATQGPAASGAVGRLSSASEGSVSTGFDYGAVSRSEAYWAQSPYGAEFWAATLRYRTARYVPAAGRYLGTSFYGRRPW